MLHVVGMREIYGEGEWSSFIPPSTLPSKPALAYGVCTPRSAWFQNRYLVDATKHIVIEEYSVYSELVKGVSAFQGIGGTCVSLDIKILGNQSRGDYGSLFSTINP